MNLFAEMSPLLELSETRLQEFALLFMAAVYITRIWWFLQFKAGGERQGQTGAGNTTPTKGILYSWANVAMPWAMESTRKRFILYLQFVVFHLGVAVAILLSFIIPYLPWLLQHPMIVLGIQVITGAACAVGVIRMIRRIGSRYMRAISSPDDYFSLVLLTVWLLLACLAAPNDTTTHGEGIVLTFFIMTAFFLVYVPFSKISHYLYYPFTRYYFGKSMGYRGVFPVRHGPKAG